MEEQESAKTEVADRIVARRPVYFVFIVYAVELHEQIARLKKQDHPSFIHQEPQRSDHDVDRCPPRCAEFLHAVLHATCKVPGMLLGVEARQSLREQHSAAVVLQSLCAGADRNQPH